MTRRGVLAILSLTSPIYVPSLQVLSDRKVRKNRKESKDRKVETEVSERECSRTAALLPLRREPRG